MTLTTTQEERTGATITYVLTGLFSWLGGLIGWLIWRNKGPFAQEQTTEALNFGLTTLIAFILVNILTRIIPFLGILTLLIWVAQLVFSIMGAVAANKGESYRYPYSLRLVK
jgi:uncharacterized Tic20 family protein